jgi:hypothetical protein
MRVPFVSNSTFSLRRPGGNPRRTRPRLEALEDRSLPTVVAAGIPDLIVNGGLAHTSTAATKPDVAVAGDGTIDVVFTENTSSGTSIFVRRFTADGGPLPTNPTITVASGAAGALGSARIAFLSVSDAFVVAYVAPSANVFQSVFARRFGTDGNPTGNVVTVATTDYGTSNQVEPALATTALGEFFVSWTDYATPTNGDIRARGFQSNDVPFTPADAAIAATSANEHESAIDVSTGSNNRITIGFTYTIDGAETTQNVLYTFRASRDLSFANPPVQVNLTSGAASQSSISFSGGLTVAWVDRTPGSSANIRARHNKLGFDLAGPEIMVDQSAGDKIQPRVAGDSHDGRYLITYIDDGVAGGQAVFVEYDTFSRLQTMRRVVTIHSAAQANPAIATNSNGKYAMVMDDQFTGQTEPWLRTFQRLPTTFFAIGGSSGRVRIIRASNGAFVDDFLPYGSAYTGPVAAAFGDVNGDGFPDLVTSALAGNPDVRVYDGQAIFNGTFNSSHPEASQILQFFAYGLNFNIGTYVGLGSVNDDGYADIITGASAGNPHIRVFSSRAIFGSGEISASQGDPPAMTTKAEFFAYGLNFNVGATVAAADLYNSGYADIVTGATVGNPHVKVYRGMNIATGTFDPTNPDASLATQFFAYPTDANIGVSVAAAPQPHGIGTAIVTGATIGAPLVEVFNPFLDPANPDAGLETSFYAFDPQSGIGVNVAVASLQDNTYFDILTGANAGAPQYRLVNGHATGNIPPAVNGIDATLPFDTHDGATVGA